MSHNPVHHCTGTISQASSAAFIALKLRAIEWELPLSESEGEICVDIWDCRLRLTHQTNQLRIELTGPETRLIGNLRDSATEIFAGAGLQVQWDDLDVGGLAPGLSLMKVVSIDRISPGFLRVRLSGSDAGRFGQGGLHFRLILPPAGRPPVWPRIAASGRTEWPDGRDALHRPVYTIAAYSKGWLDFDIFIHPQSPTCDWALSNPIGQVVAAIGPGGGGCPEADRLWLFGDETAQPAITRILQETRADIRATLSTSCPEDLGALANHPCVERCNDLVRALKDTPNFEGGFIWFAGSAAQARAAREHLLARGIAKKDFRAVAYWD